MIPAESDHTSGGAVILPQPVNPSQDSNVLPPSNGAGGAVILPFPIETGNSKPPSGAGNGAGGAVVLPHPLPGGDTFLPPVIGYPEPPCCQDMIARTSMIPCIPCNYHKPEPNVPFPPYYSNDGYIPPQVNQIIVNLPPGSLGLPVVRP